MKLNIKMHITRIKVEEKYFTFKYKLWEEDDKTPTFFGDFEGTHGWSSDPKGFKELLESGYAFRLVLDLVYNNIKHS